MVPPKMRFWTAVWETPLKRDAPPGVVVTTLALGEAPVNCETSTLRVGCCWNPEKLITKFSLRLTGPRQALSVAMIGSPIGPASGLNGLKVVLLLGGNTTIGAGSPKRKLPVPLRTRRWLLLTTLFCRT